MDPASTGVIAIIVLLGLLIVGWSSAVELCLSDVDRKTVRQHVERGDRRAIELEKLLSDSGRILFALAIFKLFGMILAIVAIASVALPPFQPLSIMVWSLSLWIAIVVVSVSGRSFGDARPVSFTLANIGALLWLGRILRPITAPLNLLSYAISSGQENEAGESSTGENIFLSDDGLRLLMDVRSEVETIQDTERQMIVRILDMDDTIAREVMIPRIDIVALDANTDFQSALDVIIEAGHSRIPVYEEDADHILGLLYAKDLLKSFREQRTDISIREILRPAHFVPESKKLDALFAEMQKRRVHIAIVVDEYGGTAGLLTVEDILEEIVGDIQDEYDVHQDALVQRISAERFLLKSKLPVSTVVELLATDFDVDNVDTLGGFVYSLIGRVPEQGESVDVRGWRFTVVNLDGHRIDQVRVESVDTLSPRSAHVNVEGKIGNSDSVTNFLRLN